MNINSKLFDRIRVRPRETEEAVTAANRCQWDGCERAGLYRAPVGRQREGEYFRFCVDHVRQYNKSYNYFSGLADSEISRLQKEALTGHRPTWKMGTSRTAAAAAPDLAGLRSGSAGYYRRIRDPFDLFPGDGAAPERVRRPRPLEGKALETLGLPPNATGAEIRTRYKELVKRHHPDLNGGNRDSEDRFRDVIQAYRLLRQAGLC